MSVSIPDRDCERHRECHRALNRPRLGVATAPILAAALLACEGSSSSVAAPRGSSAIERAVIVGGAIAAGMQSGGLVAESQAVAWPSLLGAQAGVSIRAPAVRSPGCPAPLVAPLLLGRRLSGGSADVRDTTCAGAATDATPPADNMAIAGATAWAALHLTPKAIASAPSSYDVYERQRYPLVLGNTQSQVTAMLVKAPRFVAVELGLAEVARAAVSGHVAAAASYADTTAWTFVPAAVFRPVFDQIADSVAKSAAAVAIASVPRVTRLPAFQAATNLWNARAELAGFGIHVSANCSASPNVVHVAGVVPRLARRAVTTGAAQPLSCADVPGAADEVLTPAAAAQLDAAVDAINQHMSATATQRGWAFVSLDSLYAEMSTAAGVYQATRQLRCAEPFGQYLSLDGIHPAARGQQRIADAVAAALNARYGYRIPLRGEPLDLTAPCP